MNQDPIIQTIIDLLDKQGKSQKNLTDYLGITQNAFTDWKSGRIKSYRKHLARIAEFLNVSVDYLLGKDEAKIPSPLVAEKSNLIPLSQNNVYSVPVVENVSAGFGTLAIDDIVDYMPLYFTSAIEADETICIKVKGDSMYPKIENGDVIQVHKQTSVDSGSIAVVLLDEEEGLVKKVVYGPDWIELHSINPMYPVQRFEGRNVLRLRVVGLVKKIIKSV